MHQLQLHLRAREYFSRNESTVSDVTNQIPESGIMDWRHQNKSYRRPRRFSQGQARLASLTIFVFALTWEPVRRLLFRFFQEQNPFQAKWNLESVYVKVCLHELPIQYFNNNSSLGSCNYTN